LIPGFGKYYEVSNLGNVRSYYFRNGKPGLATVPQIKAQSFSTPQDYLYVNLRKNGRGEMWAVHILVAIVFVPNDDPKHKKYVNHKKGDKLDNRAKMLEWVTSGDNQRHAYASGLRLKLFGEKNGRNKLKESEVMEIFSSEEKHYVLAAAYNITTTVVHHIKSGKLWSHLTGKKYERTRSILLSDAQALEIFNSKETQVNLAEKYGVYQGTISAIKTGRSHSNATGKIFKDV
jgi:hypothetical protein